MRREADPAKPRGGLLRAEGLRKAYGGHAVLRGVELSLAPGELVGVTGENGSGKSTLLRLLVGDLAPDAGRVETTARVGYCPQQSLVFDQLTVVDNLAYFAAAYGLTGSNGWLQRLPEDFGLARCAATPVGELSGGTRQKLNLCLALLHDPEALLLDEPYSGFDWETYLLFWSLAERLRREGRGLLVVSHLFHERQRFDRIHRLVEGELRCG